MSDADTDQHCPALTARPHLPFPCLLPFLPSPPALLPLFISPHPFLWALAFPLSSSNSSARPHTETHPETHARARPHAPVPKQESSNKECSAAHGCRQGRRRWRRRGGRGGGGARRAEDGAALRRLRGEGQEGHQARAWYRVLFPPFNFRRCSKLLRSVVRLLSPAELLTRFLAQVWCRSWRTRRRTGSS